MAGNNSKDLKQCTTLSTDGASLHYYSLGTGPGVIILHGSISYGLSHRDLAYLLAENLTVHLVSRRERGFSGRFPEGITKAMAVLPRPAADTFDDMEDHKMLLGGRKGDRTYSEGFASAVLNTELSDLNQIIKRTQARHMLGISTGAVLMLAACTNPLLIPALAGIEKMIFFEPPLQFRDINTGLDVEGAQRFEAEMARGDVAGGMATAMKIVQLGPGWLPRGIMKFITSLMLHSDKKVSAANTDVQGNTTMSELAPMLRYDFALVERMICQVSAFQNVAEGRHVLLLGGSKSPAYFGVVMDQLAKTMTGAQRVVVRDVGHEVACNTDFRGRPDKIAAIIKDFFVSKISDMGVENSSIG